jgi:hypothetical protein
MQRGEERKKESWYFTDYLSHKSESGRLDLLYRFYRGQAKKPKPRLEMSLEGLAQEKETRPIGNKNRAFGVRADGWIVDVFSALTGLPTLNVVPGVRLERLEENDNPFNRVAVRWGPSVRLFGVNQQDTALFFSHLNTRRSVQGEKFSSWAYFGGGRIYLAPFLAVEGGSFFSEKALRGKPSPLAEQRGFEVASFLEVAAVRAGFRYEEESFHLRQSQSLVREKRPQVFLGISY